MAALKLISVGNSVGVVLPKEMLVKLGLQKGDTLHAVETPEGFRLTVGDSEFETQMAVARRVMKERYAVLRELAK
jgi:putative addiction module antidote